MERVIICPNCGSEHHCFEEMQEDYSSFMCFQCGFMSDSRFNDTDAEGYESKLDVDNAMTSDKNDFLSAIKEMGITKDLRVEKS